MTPEEYQDLANWTLNVSIEVQDIDLGCPVLMQEYISNDLQLCQEVNFWTDVQGDAHVKRRYYPNGHYIIDDKTDAALFATCKTQEDYEWYLAKKEQWPRYDTITEALNARDEQLRRVGEAVTYEGYPVCHGCGRRAGVTSIPLPDGTQQMQCAQCGTEDPYKS